MKKKTKSILIVSDMHVGSSTAVCTKSPDIADLNTTYKPNRLQSTLLKGWENCIADLTQKPDLLVVNGEPCDGGNPKGLGKQSWSTSLEDQLNDAEKLLNMIPYKKIMFTRGSGYHVDMQGTNFEEILANRMGAEKYKSFGGSGSTDYYALVEVYGKMFNFTHHVGFNKWASYRTTALAREMAGMVFEKDKMGRADVIVRSHVHYFVHVEFRTLTRIYDTSLEIPRWSSIQRWYRRYNSRCGHD